MTTLIINHPTNHTDEQALANDYNRVPGEEEVKLSLLTDLWKSNWQIKSNNSHIEVHPPRYYTKSTIKQSMSVKRNEIIRSKWEWIEKHIDMGRQLLADGDSVLKSCIKPTIEVCENEKQHRLFRLFRYYWSSPYSEYVGRRIRLIIRDAGLTNNPIIGIAALGSPIIHIPERDNYIGWDKKTRTNNLIYAMDAYIIGALPPYNYLLGGKLISYILASNEIREIYRRKYADKVTLINKRQSGEIVCLFTTSLYGKSSQYNRLKYDNKTLYQLIGQTKGYGTLHISELTIGLMKEFALKKGISIGHDFGDGPSWRIRLIRTVGDLLGFNTDLLLRHSFAKNIYYISLAENSLEFLNGEDKKPKYFDYPLEKLVDYWKHRWLNNRQNNPDIIRKVRNFRPKDFQIEYF
jgi:hypothetical protein